MEAQNIRPADIAISFKISRQLANHIVNHGGVSYLDKLIKILHCKEEDITYTIDILKHKARKRT